MTMNDKDKPDQQTKAVTVKRPQPGKSLRIALLHVRRTIESHQSKSLRPV
jgi:hypothetical protein